MHTISTKHALKICFKKKQCYFYFVLHIEHMGLYKLNVYEENHMEQLIHEYLKDCSQAPARL